MVKYQELSQSGDHHVFRRIPWCSVRIGPHRVRHQGCITGDQRQRAEGRDRVVAGSSSRPALASDGRKWSVYRHRGSCEPRGNLTRKRSHYRMIAWRGRE